MAIVTRNLNGGLPIVLFRRSDRCNRASRKVLVKKRNSDSSNYNDATVASYWLGAVVVVVVVVVAMSVVLLPRPLLSSSP